MKELQKLKTLDEYNTFLNNQANHSDILLLKISSRCTISFVVQKIFELWFKGVDQETKLRCGIVDVVSAREISNQIAKDFSLKHESPQAIWLTKEKTVMWSESHHRITAEALQSCLTSR
ncbi:MAG: bacillithiol system redox-active protein YtxJ [Ignavibacteria bacterium CG_4_8_14_3_um_filter_37_9]|nr:MAG: bacillithiol system redox-active protein YtxJ [Ignavibacteria bacterium CG_4_8_14_3_um_filter_37_9]